MGKEGKYDLKLADPPPMTETDSDSESEVQSEAVTEITSVESLTPSKLIRSAVLQVLKSMSIVIGLEAKSVSKSAGLNFASCVRGIIEKGQKLGSQCQNSTNFEDSAIMLDEPNLLAIDQCSSWATLGFLRAISASEVWINS